LANFLRKDALKPIRLRSGLDVVRPISQPIEHHFAQLRVGKHRWASLETPDLCGPYPYAERFLKHPLAGHVGEFLCANERALERDDQFIGLPWIRREALEFARAESKYS
jgi:hypothetical protein